MAERPRLTLLTEDPPPQQWIRVVWVGDVDASSVGPLASNLRDAWELDPLVLEVDLAGVTFLDAAGLRPLVEAHARLLHRMRLFDPAPAVTRLLRLLGLEDMFLIVAPVSGRPATEPRTWQARSGASGPEAHAAAAGESGPLSSSSDRVTIEQAKGLLMAVHGCDASSAWDVLRGHARDHDVSIHVMAELLVANAPGSVLSASQTVAEDILAERARAGPPAE